MLSENRFAVFGMVSGHSSGIEEAETGSKSKKAAQRRPSDNR
jgi:hypothetical protein